MQKIAIIGCNSFLAKHLIDKLSTDNSLFLYGRTAGSNHADLSFTPFNYPEIPLDLTGLLDYDVIIYTAAAGVQANSNEPALLTYQINTFLPIEIVSFLDGHSYKGRLITFGSYFEIGDHQLMRPFNEEEVVYSTAAVPNGYCDSKRLLSRFFMNKRFSMNWNHLIIPSLYGPGENENRLIPYVVKGLKEKLDLKLSSGEQIRQYLFVSDLTALISQLISSDLSSELYNVAGPDEPLRIRDLVTMIFEMMGVVRAETDTVNTRDQAMGYLSISNEKVKQALPGWSPKVNLSAGIKQYL